LTLSAPIPHKAYSELSKCSLKRHTELTELKLMSEKPSGNEDSENVFNILIA
jgi:hypothetical protein